MDTEELARNLVDNIIGGNNVEAKTDFEAIISQKISGALEDKKIEIAQSIYSKEEDTDESEEADTSDS